MAGRCRRRSEGLLARTGGCRRDRGPRREPREPAPIVAHVVGVGKTDAGSGQDVHEVGREVDGRGANRGQDFDAQAIFQLLGSLVASPDVAQSDGAVFPESLPRAVTQRIAPDPDLVQAGEEGARDLVGQAIVVLECLLELLGEGMKGVGHRLPERFLPSGKCRFRLLDVLEFAGRGQPEPGPAIMSSRWEKVATVLPSCSRNALEPLFVGQCSGKRARSATGGMASVPLESSRKADGGGRSLADIEAALRRIAERIEETFAFARVQTGVLREEGTVNKLFVRERGTQIKVEVTPVLRGCVFEPEEKAVSDAVEEQFGFAAVQVVSFPDLFDVHDLLSNEGIDDGLRTAFVVYLVSHHRPIENLLAPEYAEVLLELVSQSLVGVRAREEDMGHGR